MASPLRWASLRCGPSHIAKPPIVFPNDLFRPFSRFYARAQVWLFREEWRDDGHDEWAVANGRWEKAVVIFDQIFRSARLGKTFLTLLAGFPDAPEKRGSQIIAWIGWAFFCLIVLSAYTANLAAWLGVRTDSPFISSIDVAVEQQARICVASAVLDELEALYPTANFHPISFSREMNVTYVEEKCKAIVWSMPVVLRTPKTAAFMCAANLFAVQPILALPFAFPATERLAPAFNTFIATHRNTVSPPQSYLTNFESQYWRMGCDDGTLFTDQQRSAESGAGQCSTEAGTNSRRRRLVKMGQRGPEGLMGGSGHSHDEDFYPVTSNSVEPSRRRLRSATSKSKGAAGGGSCDGATNDVHTGLTQMNVANFLGPLIIWITCLCISLVKSINEAKVRLPNQEATLEHVQNVSKGIAKQAIRSARSSAKSATSVASTAVKKHPRVKVPVNFFRRTVKPAGVQMIVAPVAWARPTSES